ncbi:MAG: hypothetical protein WC654_02570 [Patescibacteria group bacterium]
MPQRHQPRRVTRKDLARISAPLVHPLGEAGSTGPSLILPDSPLGQVLEGAKRAAGSDHPTLGYDPRFDRED